MPWQELRFPSVDALGSYLFSTYGNPAHRVPVWRGESQEFPSMLPRIDREFNVLVGRPCCRRDFEQAVFTEFWELARPLLRRDHLVGTRRPHGGLTIDALNFVQHHGCPTRLLDWSSSSWVALYFAACADATCDGRLWGFDSHALESVLHSRWDGLCVPKIAGSADRDLEAALFDLPPTRWVSVQYNFRPCPRMAAQQGLFTLAGSLGVSHHDLLAEVLPEEALWCIHIPAGWKAGLLGQLRNFGVHHDSLQFPILDAFAQQVVSKYQTYTPTVPLRVQQP